MENVKLKGVTNKTTLAELITIVNTKRTKKRQATKLTIETYYGKIIYFAAGSAAETATIIQAIGQAQNEPLRSKITAANTQIDKATVGMMCALNAAVTNDGETTVYYW